MSYWALPSRRNLDQFKHIATHALAQSPVLVPFGCVCPWAILFSWNVWSKGTQLKNSTPSGSPRVERVSLPKSRMCARISMDKQSETFVGRCSRELPLRKKHNIKTNWPSRDKKDASLGWGEWGIVWSRLKRAQVFGKTRSPRVADGCGELGFPFLSASHKPPGSLALGL